MSEKVWKFSRTFALVAMAMAAMLFIGCSKKAQGGDTIKIGVLYSVTGSFSLSETPMYNAAKMAIDEINAAGGINGKKIEAIFTDYGSDPAMAAEKAQQLILKDKVAAIIGTNASNTRLAVIPTIEKYNSLLVYNTYYEGEKPSPSVLYTNTCPNQQITPMIPYMINNYGKKIFIVGSDYEFGRKSIAFAKTLIAQNGGVVVGEEYAPTTESDFSSIINKIKSAKPDAVFSAVAGNSGVPFYKDYVQYGMVPQTVPIFSIAAHESAIKAIGSAAVGNFAAFDYFNTIDTPENKAFISKYESLFGTETTVTNSAEGAYHGTYMLAEAMKKAKSLSPADIIAAAANLEVKTPAGIIKMDAVNHHAWLNVYLGRVNKDLRYDILYKSEGLVAPVAE